VFYNWHCQLLELNSVREYGYEKLMESYWQVTPMYSEMPAPLSLCPP